jgi:hypothetical protein
MNRDRFPKDDKADALRAQEENIEEAEKLASGKPRPESAECTETEDAGNEQFAPRFRGWGLQDRRG